MRLSERISAEPSAEGRAADHRCISSLRQARRPDRQPWQRSGCLASIAAGGITADCPCSASRSAMARCPWSRSQPPGCQTRREPRRSGCLEHWSWSARLVAAFNCIMAVNQSTAGRPHRCIAARSHPVADPLQPPPGPRRDPASPTPGRRGQVRPPRWSRWQVPASASSHIEPYSETAGR